MNNELEIQIEKTNTFSGKQTLSCAMLYVDTFKNPPWNEDWHLGTAITLINKIVSKKGFIGFVANCSNKEKGYLLGYLIKVFFPFIHAFYINELFVDTNYQNLKIGRNLITSLLSHIANENFSLVVLITKKNTNAEKFYKKLGFKRVIPLLSIKKRIIMYYRIKPRKMEAYNE